MPIPLNMQQSYSVSHLNYLAVILTSITLRRMIKEKANARFGKPLLTASAVVCLLCGSLLALRSFAQVRSIQGNSQLLQESIPFVQSWPLCTNYMEALNLISGFKACRNGKGVLCKFVIDIFANPYLKNGYIK